MIRVCDSIHCRWATLMWERALLSMLSFKGRKFQSLPLQEELNIFRWVLLPSPVWPAVCFADIDIVCKWGYYVVWLSWTGLSLLHLLQSRDGVFGDPPCGPTPWSCSSRLPNLSANPTARVGEDLWDHNPQTPRGWRQGSSSSCSWVAICIQLYIVLLESGSSYQFCVFRHERVHD